MPSIASFIDTLFGHPQNTSLENPAISLEDPEAWEAIGGSSKAESGVTVNHHTALTSAAVWQAVSIISGDLASMPLNVYQSLPEGGRDIFPVRLDPADGKQYQKQINVELRNERLKKFGGYFAKFGLGAAILSAIPIGIASYFSLEKKIDDLLNSRELLKKIETGQNEVHFSQETSSAQLSHTVTIQTSERPFVGVNIVSYSPIVGQVSG